MKNLIIYLTVILFSVGCSKATLDNINKDRNNRRDVAALEELPSAIVESAFAVTGTEMAWFASVYTEQNAGSEGQLRDADRRVGSASPSTFDGSWSSIYDNLMILKDMIDKCSPTGSEPDNKPVLGIAQLLTAYNLAVATDMWGQIPWSEALKGLKNLKPTYDKQEDLYKTVIIKYLNDAIANLSQPIPAENAALFAKNDLMYGGNQENWIRAAWSLKARYFMRMQKVVSTAVDSALACIPYGFTGDGDAFVFSKYEDVPTAQNPWYQFWVVNGYAVAGETLYNLMDDRNDPRIEQYFVKLDNQVIAAPNGQAEQSYAGEIYSYSTFSEQATTPTPLMTYHELMFIQAEAQARKGEDFSDALKEAIVSSFAYHGSNYTIAYYNLQVFPRLGLTLNSRLKEILTQKYIAQYEAEALEVYNDYRRTRIPDLHNPNNALVNYGFVERYPYPSSEIGSNSNHVPETNIFQSKVWWAGGTE